MTDHIQTRANVRQISVGGDDKQKQTTHQNQTMNSKSFMISVFFTKKKLTQIQPKPTKKDNKKCRCNLNITYKRKS